MAPELDLFDPEREPAAAGNPLARALRQLRQPPRRDGMAVAFGLAFILFGCVGLLRAAGAHVPSVWLYPIILIGLGVAGLWSSLSRGAR